MVARARELTTRYVGLDGMSLLRPLIEHEFSGRLAVVSSFGAESAVILAMAAEIDRTTPVLFLDTGKLFGQTLRYRDRLIAQLGLADVRTIQPDAAQLSAADSEGMLWLHDPDSCCRVRKIEPIARALRGFDAWVTGRKRYHGGIGWRCQSSNGTRAAVSRSILLPNGHGLGSRRSSSAAISRGIRSRPMAIFRLDA